MQQQQLQQLDKLTLSDTLSRFLPGKNGKEKERERERSRQMIQTASVVISATTTTAAAAAAHIYLNYQKKEGKGNGKKKSGNGENRGKWGVGRRGGGSLMNICLFRWANKLNKTEEAKSWGENNVCSVCVLQCSAHQQQQPSECLAAKLS